MGAGKEDEEINHGRRRLFGAAGAVTIAAAAAQLGMTVSARAAEGYRVIVPYFRGHGTTTFLSGSTPRIAQQSAVALDIIALASVTGYLITNLAANLEPLPAAAEWASRPAWSMSSPTRPVPPDRSPTCSTSATRCAAFT